MGYPVLNLPPLPAPSPELGCGGGDKKCRKSKESPPWVCEKCAKKRKTSEATLDLGRPYMGCPDHDAASVEAEGETSEATLDLGCSECEERKKRNPDETSEATLDLGCKKCQKGKKRRIKKQQENLDLFPSGMLNLRGPMLRQVPIIGQQQSPAPEWDETWDELLGLGQPSGMLGQVPLKKINWVFPDETTSEATLDLGRPNMMRRVPIAGMGVEWVGEMTEEPTLDLGRRGSMLGQVRLADGGRGGESVPYQHARNRYWDEDEDYYLMGRKRCNGIHRVMGQANNYPCPLNAPALDPTLNCQRDARGNAVCSNGMYFPPGCPHTPPDQYFSPGIAPDEVHNGILEARVPAPRSAGTSGAAAAPAAGPTPAGAPIPVTSSNIVPIAAGGLAAAGLLYALLR